MNKNIKKILYTSIPAIIILITITICFYVKANNLLIIRNNTTDNELMIYKIETFESNKALNFTEDKPEYQTKIIINLISKAKFELDSFDVKINIYEKNNNDIWVYEKKDVSFFTNEEKLIITSTRKNELSDIGNVCIKFKDNYIPIYTEKDYILNYGENNQLVSETSVKVFTNLTFAFIAFTLVAVTTTILLICLYIDPKKKKKLKNKTKKLL